MDEKKKRYQVTIMSAIDELQRIFRKLKKKTCRFWLGGENMLKPDNVWYNYRSMEILIIPTFIIKLLRFYTNHIWIDKGEKEQN